MLVFGDAALREDPQAKIARLGDMLDEAAATTGIRRHSLLVCALIEAGELAQGLADHDFAQVPVDRRFPPAEAAMALAVDVARLVHASWQASFAPAALDGQPARSALAELRSRTLPDAITVKQPEGFAHYGLYPEAYLEAARELPRDARLRVLGIRSIGTTLAAAVAAAIGSAANPVMVRPQGHPFRRRIAIGPDLAEEIRGDPDARWAVADEGPGLSGSSFAAAATLLREHGVRPDRIHFLPGHAGEPGPEADAAVRDIWQAAPRHVRSFDDVVLAAPDPGRRLQSWVADLTGPAQGGLLDISGGAWRSHTGRPEQNWPPVHAQQEKRKFLLRSETGRWLLKFAGLDRAGRDKGRIARLLHRAGFAPEPLGWRHGFLVERWHGDARPLDANAIGREALVARLGEYLGFRAAMLPLEPEQGGACTARLFEMARTNAAEALGEAAACGLERWRPALQRLEGVRRPVRTDGRLHAWEWIEVDGRILKTDGLDHHVAHDLVGGQDIAWDIAGASVEFGLAEDERRILAGLVESRAGHPVDRELVRFCEPCYLAFQLGYYTFAEAAAAPCERGRVRLQRDRYRALLATALDANQR
jgi:hypothetical protein